MTTTHKKSFHKAFFKANLLNTYSSKHPYSSDEEYGAQIDKENSSFPRLRKNRAVLSP